LLAQLRDFLLELGVGFAFVASQYRLDIAGRFFLNLLFYHLKLRCFVVIDLKSKAFEPEFVSKMNFYLAAVDDLLRHPEDRPSIGLIICKKDQIVAEYALRNTTTPIGISEYKLSESLPADLQGSLPTIEELENEFGSGAEVQNSQLNHSIKSPAQSEVFRRTMGQVSQNYWATVSPDERRERGRKNALARWVTVQMRTKQLIVLVPRSIRSANQLGQELVSPSGCTLPCTAKDR
jgi:hypothetical protein